MKFWREEDPEIAPDGTIIKGGMFPHQRDFWNQKNFIKGLVAGFGAGKTLVGAKRAIAITLQNAPAPYLAISPTYKMAKRTVIPTIQNLLEGKKTIHRDLRYKFNKSDHQFTINFRGRIGTIWVASGEEPNSLKGPNIGAAWIDEPFIQDGQVLQEAIARVRDRQARMRELILTGTPEELNWGYDICEGERKDDYDLGVVHASTKANLALDKSYAETLEKAFDPLAVEALVGGQFVNLTGGRVYYSFDRQRNIRKLPDPGVHYGVGMDFNVDPMSAIVFWVSGNHMHIVKEYELPNADTYAMCDTLQKDQIFPRGHPREGECRIREVFPDATGKARKTSTEYGRTDFTVIESFGWEINAPEANPNIRDRENSVNGKLYSGKKEVTLTIDPECKKLIGYFNKYTHKNKNKKEHKAMSHLIDAAGYPVHRLFPAYKPELKQASLLGH